jgi:hypothetical protein
MGSDCRVIAVERVPNSSWALLQEIPAGIVFVDNMPSAKAMLLLYFLFRRARIQP